MSGEIEKIEKKITAAEESYKRINGAWLSASEIKGRIDSLLILARELKAAEADKSE